MVKFSVYLNRHVFVILFLNFYKIILSEISTSQRVCIRVTLCMLGNLHAFLSSVDVFFFFF